MEYLAAGDDEVFDAERVRTEAVVRLRLQAFIRNIGSALRPPGLRYGAVECLSPIQRHQYQPVAVGVRGSGIARHARSHRRDAGVKRADVDAQFHNRKSLSSRK